MRLLSLAYAAVFVPTLASAVLAQASHGRLFQLRFRIPTGHATSVAPACDNSGFEAIAGRKKLGRALGIGGAVVAAGGLYAAQSASLNGNALEIGVLGLGTALAGAYIYGSADTPKAMDQAVQSLKVGETRSADVATCLGRPSSTTTRGAGEEIWTYATTKSSTTGGVVGMFLPFIPHGGSTEMRSVTLTFKNGLLSDVTKTAAGF